MHSECLSGYVVYDYEHGVLVCNGTGEVINDRPLETEVGLTPVVGYGVVNHGVDTRGPLGRLSESAFRAWRDLLGGVVSKCTESAKKAPPRGALGLILHLREVARGLLLCAREITCKYGSKS